MRKILLAGVVLALCGSAGALIGAPYPSLTGSVSVCDPWDPQNCIQPESDGSIPVTGTLTPAPSPDPSAAIAPIVTAAAGSDLVVKASAGNFYGFSLTTGATAGYALVFNATSAPANGAVTPVKCLVVGQNSTIGASFEPPIRLDTGIVVSFSSTGCFTKTSSATAFISGQAE